MKPKAFVLDAYGTLFDVHSVVLRNGNNIPGDLQALSRLWRQKQLEYTWLRSLMERYEDFCDVTEAALRSAAGQLRIEASDMQLDTLMQAYLFPSAFPDARPALEALKGAPLAILSNGSPGMLESAVRHNGLDSYFAEIISADRVKTYKPSPRVYALGTEILNLPASDVLFISSNSWDAAGAKAFGYRVCWCNRSTTEMEYLGCAPDLVVPRLDQITPRLWSIQCQQQLTSENESALKGTTKKDVGRLRNSMRCGCEYPADGDQPPRERCAAAILCRLGSLDGALPASRSGGADRFGRCIEPSFAPILQEPVGEPGAR